VIITDKVKIKVIIKITPKTGIMEGTIIKMLRMATVKIQAVTSNKVRRVGNKKTTVNLIIKHFIDTDPHYKEFRKDKHLEKNLMETFGNDLSKNDY
jgi:predicted metallo-beta-lactamase superfamily hydrolase